MATSETAPLDLGVIEELERLKQAAHDALNEPGRLLSQRAFEAQSAWTGAVLDKKNQLLAAARELLELKSALGFLEALDEDDVSPPCANVGEILKYANELGWTPGDK